MKKEKSEKFPLKKTVKLTLRMFGIWYKNYPKLFFAATVCSIIGALTPYVNIYLTAQLINELAGGRDINKLLFIALIILVADAVLALLNSAFYHWKSCQYSGYYFKWIRFFSDKLLNMDYASLDNSYTGDLFEKINRSQRMNGWGIGKAIPFYEAFLSGLIGIFGAVGLSVSLFTIPVPESAGAFTVLNNPVFAVLIVLIMLFVTSLSSAFSVKASSYWVKISEHNILSNKIFNFYMYMANDKYRASDIRIYRQDIFCDKSFKKHDDLAFMPKGIGAKFAKGEQGLFSALSSAVSAVFIGLVYVFVCIKAWAGAFGVGSVTQYIGSITALSGCFGFFLSTLGNIRNNASFLEPTFEFFDIPDDMDKGHLKLEKPENNHYEIEFKNVSFKYPGADDYALRNINIKFRVGEKLAVVGENGSGKTTFIKLLCRLYDPTDGEIYLNGVNIKDYLYEDYISVFSVVFQDFCLLAFKLAENVAASAEYDSDKVISCLEKAGFSERLKTMPDGIETSIYKDLEKDGVEISGGEAQKIAIARALYKDAPFIILDEPTASLDPVAEFEIYSKFNDLVGDKTAIFISHRLSSCRFCDDIAVFDKGRLIQRGGHNNLVADKNGKYCELWNAQAQYYS